MRWRLALDITPRLSFLLHTPPSAVNSGDEKKETAPKEPNKSKKAISKKTASVKRKASVTTVDYDSASSDSPRPKRARLTSSKSSVAAEDLLQRRLSMAVSTCAWLPTLLLVHGGVIGVVAIATRTGRVALIGVKLPIVVGK